MARRQKFEDHFWSDHNQGFEVLLQGMKSQISASKELMDFIKERASVEDAHTKTINKFHKQMGHSNDSTTGAFFPVWIVSVEMLGKLAEANTTFVRNLTELAKEVSEYHQSQKDKFKSNMKGEIEAAKEAYHTLEVAETAVHKTKKTYEAAHHEHAALQYDLTALQSSGVAGKIDKVDAKVKKAEAVLIHAKQEYTSAVDNHVKQMMEYQGKHKEACAKFESIEEEHLAQMITFTIQLASVLEANVGTVDKVQKDTVRKISDLSVDKLIGFYIQTKGTGKDIPRPAKVRLVKDASPSPSNTSAVSQSNTSTASTSVTESTSHKSATVAKEKGLKKLFKRTGKQAAVEGGNTTSNGPTTSQPDAEQPEVDEEGYSIRPQDAGRITGFSDITAPDSDSDLDDDSYSTNKLKSIHIREASNPVSTATVDDIKASLKGLQLPSQHVNISKAGSLNALHKLNTIELSPPSNRRNRSPVDSTSTSLSSNKPMALSLFDLDAKNDDSQLNTPPGMPPPLIPTISLGETSVTTTTTPDQLPGSGSDKKQSKADTTDFADFSANFGNTSTTHSPWGDADTPTGKKTSTPLATTPILSTLEISTPPTVLAKSTESNAKPSSSNIPPPSASPILPKPPQGTSRRRANKASTSSNQSTSSFTASFESDFTTTSTTTNATANTTATATAASTTAVTTTSTTSSEQQTVTNLPVPTKRRTTTSADGSVTQSSSENGSPVSTSVLLPVDKAGDESVPKKPVPVPRRNTIDRNLLSSSPLALTSMRSPTTSTMSLPNVDIMEDSNTSQMQQQQQQPHKESLTGLSSSSSLSTLGSAGSALQSKDSTSSNNVVIPIALAIQETVNASFKGKTGITKVTGEVDMSFATSFLQQLSSHDPLTFRLTNKDTVERLQHNRNLVTLNDDGSYKFNMTALCSFLNEEVSKSPTPAKFYNVQVFRYEVVLVNGIDDLPLRLRCFWKCDPTVTNYRIDYKCNESIVKGTPLNELAICVSVDGVVSRHLCKPEGKWTPDQQKLVWQFPKVGNEPQSLQAKFELSEGPSHPSPTLVQFNCEGTSLSGMQLDLIGQAYRISFRKNKLSSGKYVAMPAD